MRSPLFNYGAKFDYAKLDRTPGAIGDNFPADCLVEDCLITRSGRFEKQTAPVEIDMAQNITVRHCSIYDVPRAGINIGDGCWGGHVIEFCDIFDTVLETGDHGSFNSWGRDRYWHPDGKTVENKLPPTRSCRFWMWSQPITLRNNRWRCDHGWDIDLDDGSCNYRIYNNLLLHGGLKLREGFRRVATNNIIVNNSLHPHVWFEHSGDVFARNIVMGAYRPARMELPKWGAEVDFNLFTTSQADRPKFAAKGCDANSLVGDAQFVNPGGGRFSGESNFARVETGIRELSDGSIRRDLTALESHRAHAEDSIAWRNGHVQYDQPSSQLAGRDHPRVDHGGVFRHGHEHGIWRHLFCGCARFVGRVQGGIAHGRFRHEGQRTRGSEPGQFSSDMPATGGGPNPKLEVIRNGQRMTLEAGF